MSLIRNAQDLGNVIRATRIRLDWSQSRLAEEVGVSRQWLGAVENGKPGAELGLVLRVLAVLGMPLYAGYPDRAPPGDTVDLDRLINDARRPP